MTATVRLAIVAALGAAFLIIGGILIPVFKKIMTDDVKKHVPPLNGSEQFNDWLNWTHFKPVYRYFYFFNVTSSKEVVEPNKNVTVKEIGPYVYRVNFRRENVAFKKNNTLLAYKLYKTYTFQRNMSIGNESDVITNVNLPMLNLATRLMRWNGTVNGKLRDVLKSWNLSLFSNVNVSDALWGYKSKPLLHSLQFLDGYFGIRPINDSTYGLMYQSGQPKKTTYLSDFEVFTGIDNIKKTWRVKSWKGNDSLNVWNSKSANSINGTDGYGWPPQSNPQYVFDTEWCRSFLLTKDKSMKGTSVSGTSTNRYTFDKKDLTTPSKYNNGFCHEIIRRKKKVVVCPIKGLLNVTTCKDNIPLVLSKPHFLGVAPVCRKVIQGLSPDKTKHSTIFDIEPLSGEVVEAAKRLQLNAYVTHVTSYPITAKLKKSSIVIPVVWMNEVYSMSDKERQSLSRNVLLRRMVFLGLQYGLIALGSVLLLISAVVAFVFFLKKNRPMQFSKSGERQPLLYHE